MKQKVALVTGASQGIGFAAVMPLAKEGTTVMMNGRDSVRLQQAVGNIRHVSKSQMVGIAADLARQEACEQFSD